MVANVPGRGSLFTGGQRVEWTLAPSGVGQLVSVGDAGWLDRLRLSTIRPGKISGGYAIGTTVGRSVRITRGTPGASDDITIGRGQAWVTVTSPVEGTSHLTAFAPTVPAWDRRQASATIHWVDAQWVFPPPAVNPVGKQHTFTTTVTRQSDGSPIVGWLVRYEIIGGPLAGFAPDGAQVVEVATNELGQASVEILQNSEGDTRPMPGTSQIGIQIIGGPLFGGDSRRLLLGSGTTTKTWSAPDVALHTTGPNQAAQGAEVAYTIEVSNSGDLPMHDAVVTEEVPDGFTYVRSSPDASEVDRNLTWNLGQLGPGETRTIELVYRADRAGKINRCAKVTTAEGLSAQDCVTTSVIVAVLDLQLTGPKTAEVGTTVEFTAVVTNLTDALATDLTITDRFDAGFTHEVSNSPIESNLEDIDPGASATFYVTFTVTQPGLLCHMVEVTGAGGVRASERACLTATEPAPTAQPGLEVTKTGPKQLRVGDTAQFFVDVKNTGNVPLTNLQIADRFPPGLEPIVATDEFTTGEGELVWTLARLEPGQTHRLQVNCKCTVAQPRACNQVTVTCDQRPPIADEACVEVLPSLQRPAPPKQSGDDGVEKSPVEQLGDQPGDSEEQPADAESEAIDTDEALTPEREEEDGATETDSDDLFSPPGDTPPPTDAKPLAPPSDLRLSIAEFGDPVRVGSKVIYQLIIENRGEASDQAVELSVTFDERITPGQIETPGKTKWTVEDQTIRFEPITEIRAGETLTYRIPFQAHQVGDTKIVAKLHSGRLRKPLRVEEKTEILEP